MAGITPMGHEERTSCLVAVRAGEVISDRGPAAIQAGAEVVAEATLLTRAKTMRSPTSVRRIQR